VVRPAAVVQVEAAAPLEAGRRVAVAGRPAATLVRARRPLAARVARASSAIVHARV
jgi:hypothetical protein